ncbi:MAG: 30S ribosomal protein S8 [Ignavibacteria bacterium]|nr:30S ribosomal protein S8 [Ignavibacteria bacterium]
MTMTDPVADYLTRLRNAIQAGHKRLDIPASKLRRNLTRLLLEHGFIAGYTEIKDTRQGTIRIRIKYTDGKPSISGLRRVSRPGLRKYVGVDEAPRVLGGLGVAVLSTSKGLLTDRQARQANVGGEVLCEIW